MGKKSLYGGIDEAIGIGRTPDWELDVSADGSDAPFITMKCMIMQTAHLNRIANSLEALVDLKHKERADALRATRRGGR